MNPEDLDTIRKEIGETDYRIVQLISKRTDLAKIAGEIKKEQGLPLKNPEVEEKVMSRFADEGEKLGLDRETMENIAKLLIEQALKAEEEE